MPIYEYTCQACQTDFELLIRGRETPQCPSCGGEKLAKHFSVPAAPSGSGKLDLPVCQTPPESGCGLPQCGMGRCTLEDFSA